MEFLNRIHIPCHGVTFALVFLSLASLLVWIAFCGVGWLHSGGGRHYGLWVVCYDLTDECQAEYGGAFWEKWAAVQATATLGFLGTNAALTMAVMYLYVERFKHNQDLAVLTGVVCICTDVLYLCGLLVIFLDFTSEFEFTFHANPVLSRPKTGYCYTLSWLVVMLGLVSGALMIRESGSETFKALSRKYHKLATDDYTGRSID